MRSGAPAAGVQRQETGAGGVAGVMDPLSTSKHCQSLARGIPTVEVRWNRARAEHHARVARAGIHVAQREPVLRRHEAAQRLISPWGAVTAGRQPSDPRSGPAPAGRAAILSRHVAHGNARVGTIRAGRRRARPAEHPRRPHRQQVYLKRRIVDGRTATDGSAAWCSRVTAGTRRSPASTATNGAPTHRHAVARTRPPPGGSSRVHTSTWLSTADLRVHLSGSASADTTRVNRLRRRGPAVVGHPVLASKRRRRDHRLPFRAHRSGRDTVGMGVDVGLAFAQEPDQRDAEPVGQRHGQPGARLTHRAAATAGLISNDVAR